MKSAFACSVVVLLALALIAGCSKEQRFESLLEQAEKARNGEHYQEAIAHYSEAIRMHPSSVLAHYERGSVFVITGGFHIGKKWSVRQDRKNARHLSVDGVT